jgi:hypothetical protein
MSKVVPRVPRMVCYEMTFTSTFASFSASCNQLLRELQAFFYFKNVPWPIKLEDTALWQSSARMSRNVSRRRTVVTVVNKTYNISTLIQIYIAFSFTVPTWFSESTTEI